MGSYSILVVDDEPDLRDLIQIRLEAAGHRVAVAVNGRKASELLLRQTFDLVITDVLMPERDGIELISEVRAKYPKLRIVVMTAGGQIPRGDYLLMAQKLGAHVTLGKPFTGEQLLNAVAAAMAGAQP
jgi:DNA-binding NtrC family response regulator